MFRFLCAGLLLFALLIENQVKAQPQIIFTQSASQSDYWAHRTSSILQARAGAACAWTGSELLIWGGGGTTNVPIGAPYYYLGFPYYQYGWTNITFNDGARYNPATDTWRAISTVNAPPPLYQPVGAWTGSKFLVCGVQKNHKLTAGTFDPQTDEWTPNAQGSPLTQIFGSVRIGAELFVWGNSSTSPGFFSFAGVRLNPASDTWSQVSVQGAPTNLQTSLPIKTATVWTGAEVIIWGPGYSAPHHAYNPATDTWRTPSTTNAPINSSFSQFAPVGVWTGTELLIWQGGSDPQVGRYNPVSDTWTKGASGPRGAAGDSSVVWTGKEMITFGGSPGDFGLFFSPYGGRYNPQTDSWLPISLPMGNGRAAHCAIWTGQEMLIFGGTSGHDWAGGSSPPGYFRDLWAYNPNSATLPLLLNWPTTETGFNLERSTNLSANAWTAMNLDELRSLAPSTNFNVKLPPPLATEFYRLHKP